MWEDPGAQNRPVHSLSAPIPSGLARRPRSPGRKGRRGAHWRASRQP